MRVSTVRMNISMPARFLKAVDQAAHKHYMSRSNFIRVALLEKMGLQNMVDLQPLPPPGYERPPVYDRETGQFNIEGLDDELRQVLKEIERDKVKYQAGPRSSMDRITPS